MAKVNLEELLGGLQEAAQVVLSIQERQHINTLSKYFDGAGNPITQLFKIGTAEIAVPLYILADHSSIGLDKLSIEFQARLLPNGDEPSKLKETLLPIFERQKQRGNLEYKHQISNISVDGDTPNKDGVATITINFKKNEKPEAVSRLVDMLIQQMTSSLNNS